MEIINRPDFMPHRHAWSDPYWDGLEAGQLLLSYCKTCNRIEYPPLGKTCCACSQALTWKPATGNAQLWSWTTFHRVYYPDYPLNPPYTVLMVELEEGVPILASLPSDIDPQDLHCDQTLQFVSIEIIPGLHIPGFKP